MWDIYILCAWLLTEDVEIAMGNGLDPVAFLKLLEQLVYRADCECPLIYSS